MEARDLWIKMNNNAMETMTTGKTTHLTVGVMKEFMGHNRIFTE